MFLYPWQENTIPNGASLIKTFPIPIGRKFTLPKLESNSETPKHTSSIFVLFNHVALRVYPAQRMHPHEYMLKQLQCEAQQGAAKLFSPRRECHWSTGAVRRLPVMQLLNLLYPASQQSTQRLWSIWTKVFRKITETSKKFKWNQDWKRIKEELGRGLSSFWGFSWVLTCVEQESKQRSASLSSSFSHISLTSSLLASFAALSLCSPGGKSAWQTRYAGEKGFSLFVPQAPLLIIKKILH